MSVVYPPAVARIDPYLLYEDAQAAVEFLTSAYGFEEHMRTMGGAGRLHVELRLEGDSLMLGQGSPDYRNPKNSGHFTALVHAYVADVDAHYDRARAAGAEILMEPTDQPNGDRRYDTRDPEGHMWSFATGAE
jgi:uncharacterized glyoxalase superfamily protein PhnB